MLHSHFPFFAHVQNGKTALHYAAEHGHTNTVKVLLAGKAKVNATDQVSFNNCEEGDCNNIVLW